MNPVDLNSHLSVLDGWLQCPQCSSEKIKRLEDFYYCEGCLAEFPIKRGIPDFRLFADPYISIRDEDEKSERIVGDGSCDFEQLIDRYYHLTPEVAPGLQERYKRGLRSGVARGQHLLESCAAPIQGPVLEVGCGTGGLMIAAGQRYDTPIVGVDIALRWLTIARQRLVESGQPALLICANAEHLPFKADVFGEILSESTLEHTVDPFIALKEMARVAKPDAPFFIQTANRTTFVEPYTGFPFPFLIPKLYRNQVIGRVCKTPYLLTPLTGREILEHFPTQTAGVIVAPYLPFSEHFGESSFLKRSFFKAYRYALTIQLGRSILACFGMFIIVSGRFKKARV